MKVKYTYPYFKETLFKGKTIQEPEKFFRVKLDSMNIPSKITTNPERKTFQLVLNKIFTDAVGENTKPQIATNHYPSTILLPNTLQQKIYKE